MGDKQMGWYSMNIAPKTGRYGGGPRILLLRSDGSASFGHYDEDKHASKPRPYWTDERAYLGLQHIRKNTPIGWMPESELAVLPREKQ